MRQQDSGLNADWCVSAWALRGGNGEDHSVFLLDEEDGTFSVVQRHFGGGGDDTVETILQGLTEAQAEEILHSGWKTARSAKCNCGSATCANTPGHCGAYRVGG